MKFRIRKFWYFQISLRAFIRYPRRYLLFISTASYSYKNNQKFGSSRFQSGSFRVIQDQQLMIQTELKTLFYNPENMTLSKFVLKRRGQIFDMFMCHVITPWQDKIWDLKRIRNLVNIFGIKSSEVSLNRNLEQLFFILILNLEPLGNPLQDRLLRTPRYDVLGKELGNRLEPSTS